MKGFWILLAAVMLGLAGCRNGINRVEGNGNITQKDKALKHFDELEVSGAFRIRVIPDNNYRVVVEADENLLEYVRVDQDGDRVRIKMKNNISFRSEHGIEIKVYGNDFRKLELAGSSSITSEGLIEQEDKVEVTIAGSGDAKLELKTPRTKVSIGGSGKVSLTGKTRDLDVSIAGSGDYLGEEYMSESAEISIAGSGNARVFASLRLDISIAGSGDVLYAGKPANIKKSVAGSGNIREL